MRALLLLALSVCACTHESTTPEQTPPQALPSTTTTATATTSAPTASHDEGDEAGARALLMKFLAPGADYAALTKPLRPSKADYTALFDAPTAAKLEPQYDKFWDKDPLVITPKAEQTELKLWAATSEELQAHKGKADEFAGGWSKIAPHLQPHQTWYGFKFVKPGESLGTAFDGLTFVNGHWVITPKPWRGL